MKWSAPTSSTPCHQGDDGLSFDSPYETVNLARRTPVNSTLRTIVAALRHTLRERFPKAFAGCPATQSAEL
jgi:hypothetical protein